MSTTVISAALRFKPAALPVPVIEVPFDEIGTDRYLVRFAHTKEEVDEALRLRFKVFNLELGEGLAGSFITGRDEDEFDSTSHHLILIERSRRQVIGTCRLRTYEVAKTIEGFQASNEFDLNMLPVDVLKSAIEVGRACIAKPYRHTETSLLLWKALALYSMRHQKKYFFGCFSLSSQDPTEGGRVFDLLSDGGYRHPSFRVNTRPGFKCLWYKPSDGPRRVAVVPQLLRTYLRLGAKLCGPPAMDRRFRTIDFLLVLDVNRIDRRLHRFLSGHVKESHDFARSA